MTKVTTAIEHLRAAFADLCADRVPARTWRLPEFLACTVMLVASTVPIIWFLRNLHLENELAMVTTTIKSAIIVSFLLAALIWLLLMSPTRLRLPGPVVGLLFIEVVIFTVAWYAWYVPKWGPWSDNADALERGATQILRLSDPYAVVTKFGGTLSPMLGGFLLALPFVVLFGNVFFQTIVWVLGGAIALLKSVGVHGACAASMIFGLTLWTRLATPSQSDNWITAAGVVATAGWGYLVTRKHPERRWLIIAVGALYGCCLTYRFIMWPTVLPLLVLFVRTFKWRRTLVFMVPAAVVTVGLTLLPLAINAKNYLNGPVAMGLIKATRSSVPFSGVIVSTITIATFALASARVRSLSGVWGASALGMAAMLLSVAATKYELGFTTAVSTYDTVAFTGTWLVFGAVSLALPTARDIANHQSARRAAGLRGR